MKRLVTIIALLVGCGDAGETNGGGAGGEGGAGGTGAVGGEGGTGGAEPKACAENCQSGFVCSRIFETGGHDCVVPGELVECDTIREPYGPPDNDEAYKREEWKLIPTTVGEEITVTQCRPFQYVEPFEPQSSDECASYTEIGDGGPIEILCGWTFSNPADLANEEVGYEESYMRRP